MCINCGSQDEEGWSEDRSRFLKEVAECKNLVRDAFQSSGKQFLLPTVIYALISQIYTLSYQSKKDASIFDAAKKDITEINNFCYEEFKDFLERNSNEPNH